MSSNYAVEAIQRSGGATPSYLFAPSVDGTVSETGQTIVVTGAVIANNTRTSFVNTDLSGQGLSGIYLLDATCTTNQLCSVSSVGVIQQNPDKSFLFAGFNNTQVLTTGPLIQIATLGGSPATDLTIFQNTGGPLTYNISFFKICSFSTR